MKRRRRNFVFVVFLLLVPLPFSAWWLISVNRIQNESLDGMFVTQTALTGKGVGIALIDSGVDQENSVLSETIFGQGWNTIDNSPNTEDLVGHGTQVASIIAGNGKRGCSPGLAPDVKLFVYKSGNEGHSANAQQQAIKMAAENKEVDIILITIGGGWGKINPKQLFPLLKAIRNDKAIISVTGNGGGKLPVHPSALAGMTNGAGLRHIIVGATVDGKKAAYSHEFGPLAKFGAMASGEAMVPSAYFLCMPGRGSSFSAPGVAAILALLTEAFPNVTMSERLEVMLSTARPIPENGQLNSVSIKTGHGMVDFEQAYIFLHNNNPPN